MLSIFRRIESKLYIVINTVWNSYLFQTFGLFRECPFCKVWNN